jgi:hypothetical protein
MKDIVEVTSRPPTLAERKAQAEIAISQAVGNIGNQIIQGYAQLMQAFWGNKFSLRPDQIIDQLNTSKTAASLFIKAIALKEFVTKFGSEAQKKQIEQLTIPDGYQVTIDVDSDKNPTGTVTLKQAEEE